MKKLISLVLSLVLCVSMIPTVTAAEAGVPATGVYMAQEGGFPSGDCLTAVERSGFGDDGSVTLSGYWEIPYTPGEGAVIYYYNAEAISLTARDNENISVTQMDAGDRQSHFWRIRLAQDVHGEQWVDLESRKDENPGSTFVDTFAPSVPSYAAGIYFSAENGAPSGSVVVGSRPEENGPWGYWDIPYDSSAEKVIYYYDAEVSSLSVNSKPDGLSVTVEDVADHFWKITLRAPGEGFGDFVLDIGTGNGSFPISFGDHFVFTYTVGLYCKPLRGVNDGTPYVDPNDPYSNVPIVMAPYFDRADLAFYFYDGTDFVPVTVDFSNLTVDPVRCDGNDFYGYLFAAYDFCDGEILYCDDASGVTYSLDFRTCLPEFAFYAGNTVSNANFRMYTIAAENTDAEFADYKFKKTLTFLPADSNFYFGLGPGSDVELEITCFRRRYLPNGNETNEIPYTDFRYIWEGGSTSEGRECITLTLYTNDSDVLCWLEGFRPGNDGQGRDWLFGGYVNVLAPDDNASLLFHANSQGTFASAKFLPQHLFDELAALGRGVTIGFEQFPGDVTLDKDVVDTIAGVTAPVSFCMTADAATEAEKDFIAAALASGETMVDVVDLSLWFGSEAKHELGGKATINYPADIAESSSVKVYYLDPEGRLEEMTAQYQNGSIVFASEHFSKFVLVEVEASAPVPDPDPTPTPDPDPTPTPAPGSEPSASTIPDFSDVAEDYWAKDAISWAAEQGYVRGTSDTEFSPQDNISRQQIWMMLSRVNGKDAGDMDAAQKWAMAAGISDGTNPGAAVTRQQLVTILYRYAVLMGYDVSVGESTNILSYDDVSSVSEYAISAFRWACGAGVVKGTTESTLSPLGTATRAQFAVMLQRFCANVG